MSALIFKEQNFHEQLKMGRFVILFLPLSRIFSFYVAKPKHPRTSKVALALTAVMLLGN